METLLTVIGLGNLLAILAIVWKGEERMGTIETNIDWLKKSLEKIEETVKDIANTQSVAKDNKNFNLMGNASPLRLMPEGLNVLEKSGMKDFVDSNEQMLHDNCRHGWCAFSNSGAVRNTGPVLISSASYKHCSL